MTDAIKLKVLRRCWLAGQVAEVGSTVKLPTEQAVDAVDSGRCEPADDVEAAELKVASAVVREQLARRLALESRAR